MLETNSKKSITKGYIANYYCVALCYLIIQWCPFLVNSWLLKQRLWFCLPLADSRVTPKFHPDLGTSARTIRKFQPSERKRAFCHFWGFGLIGKIISSTTSWDAKNIPKIILSQINLGLKIVSHLIHECPGKIDSAFNQSWDKELFQLQAGISH